MYSTYIVLWCCTMCVLYRGIDYMLQAKLADARAQEAEQKLEGLS